MLNALIRQNLAPIHLPANFAVDVAIESSVSHLVVLQGTDDEVAERAF